MYTAIRRQMMLSTARESIENGLYLGARIELDTSDTAEELLEHRATFITLKIDQHLRGCIGTLVAREPLIENIAYNAHSAAFHDPRFSPVCDSELKQLTIEVSILSETQAIEFFSQEDLLQQLRPGVDGLLLREGEYSGTFLPTVWEQIPEPDDFFWHLKNKAGLPEDYWSDTLTVERYTVESIGERR